MNPKQLLTFSHSQGITTFVFLAGFLSVFLLAVFCCCCVCVCVCVCVFFWGGGDCFVLWPYKISRLHTQKNQCLPVLVSKHIPGQRLKRKTPSFILTWSKKSLRWENYLPWATNCFVCTFGTGQQFPLQTNCWSSWTFFSYIQWNQN